MQKFTDRCEFYQISILAFMLLERVQFSDIPLVTELALNSTNKENTQETSATYTPVRKPLYRLQETYQRSWFNGIQNAASSLSSPDLSCFVLAWDLTKKGESERKVMRIMSPQETLTRQIRHDTDVYLPPILSLSVMYDRYLNGIRHTLTSIITPEPCPLTICQRLAV